MKKKFDGISIHLNQTS